MILNSGSLATTYDGAPRQHSKNDNPSWSYLGRSYGVGSSQGFNTTLGEGGVLAQAYSYTEIGYHAKSTCDFNGSTLFNVTLDPYQTVDPGLDLTIFIAQGLLPNSPDQIRFPILKTNKTASSGVLTWAASGYLFVNVVSIAANGYYKPYDSIQCTIDWAPTTFNISVNATSQTIVVDPLETQTQNEFDRRGYLISNTMASLGLLAQSAASPYYETTGESLMNNWQTYNKSLTTTLGDSSPIPAVQDSFDAMIDDILVAFGAAQLVWQFGNGSYGTVNTTLSSEYSAIRLGEDNYIYATLAVNLLILIIAIEEMIRTRNWKHLDLLDYLDLKSVIVAVSAGGTGIADECRHRHEEGTHWNGDSGSKEAAGVRINVLPSSTDQSVGPRIVLAHSGINADDKETPGGSDGENSYGLLSKR